jgi:hypothetical protein
MALVTGHRYDTGPFNTHGPCIASVAASGGPYEGTEECGAPENEHVTSEYARTLRVWPRQVSAEEHSDAVEVTGACVPDVVPPAEQTAFVAEDVAAFARALAGPLFNYRMASGQLQRRGMPRRLRRYENAIRECVLWHATQLREPNKVHFTVKVVTGDDHVVVHEDTLVAQDGDTLTVTLGNVRRLETFNQEDAQRLAEHLMSNVAEPGVATHLFNGRGGRTCVANPKSEVGPPVCGLPEDDPVHRKAELSSELDWQTLHEDLIENIMRFMPESWGGDESPEFLIERFVEEITWRLTTRGGSLERWPEDEKR